MPTKIFEYGAAQIPSIAPRTKNMTYLFHEGEQLLMFEQDNANDLYQVLKKTVVQFDQIKKLGFALQKVVQEKNSKQEARMFYLKLIN